MPELTHILEAVDHWFAERLRLGPIANHVPAYNQALKAKDNLKERLTALFGPEPEITVSLPSKTDAPATAGDADPETQAGGDQAPAAADQKE